MSAHTDPNVGVNLAVVCGAAGVLVDDLGLADFPDHVLSDSSLPNDAPTPNLCSCCSNPVGACPIYIQNMVEIIYQIKSFGPGNVPNQDGLKIDLTNTTLNYKVWDHCLAGYFDRSQIVDAVRYGWDLGLSSNPLPRDALRNHPSARDFPDDILDYLHKEQLHGCIIGPLPPDLPFPFFAMPLGTVPKTNSAVRRTITDCTNAGFGINHWIPKNWYRGEPWHIRLPNVDSIVDMVRKVKMLYPGEPVLGAKMDLSRYYRNWKVDPSQANFLGIRVNGQRYLDLAYSFGNRSAMLGSQRASNSISWMYRTKIPPYPGGKNSGLECSCPGVCSCGDNSMEAYVDDFITILPERFAMFLWNAFVALLSRLGLQPSSTPGHVCPPCNTFTALGIQFNLAENTISLPPEKLEKTIHLLQS